MHEIHKNNSTDSELAEKIRTGDAGAFEDLFRKYCQKLIHFSRRYVRDTQIAESLVQDVYLRIWQSREKLDPKSNIKSYLFTAVKNQALKHLRHAKVELQGEESITMYDEPVKTPEDELSEGEIAAAIHRAIEKLPESRKQIFKMSRYDSLTYSEIAEVQGISIKTVETQMGRALKFLRESLGHLLSILLILFK